MIKKIMLLLVVMVVVQGLVMGAEREQQPSRKPEPSFTEGVAPDDDQKEKTLIDLADRFLFDINYKAPLERFVQHSSSDVIPFLQTPFQVRKATLIDPCDSKEFTTSAWVLNFSFFRGPFF